MLLPWFSQCVLKLYCGAHSVLFVRIEWLEKTSWGRVLYSLMFSQLVHFPPLNSHICLYLNNMSSVYGILCLCCVMWRRSFLRVIGLFCKGTLCRASGLLQLSLMFVIRKSIASSYNRLGPRLSPLVSNQYINAGVIFSSILIFPRDFNG